LKIVRSEIILLTKVNVENKIHVNIKEQYKRAHKEAE